MTTAQIEHIMALVDRYETACATSAIGCQSVKAIEARAAVEAELRRLDAIESEWAALSQDDGKAQREVERLRAVNAELLEFAREYLSNWGDLDGYLQDMARAAIAKTTGETK